MTAHADDRAVDNHYARGDLVEKILAALRAAGKDPDALHAEDLASIDQFHTRGRKATLDLAHRTGVTAGMRVLDVGGGRWAPGPHPGERTQLRGGGARLTEECVRAGQAPTARTG